MQKKPIFVLTTLSFAGLLLLLVKSSGLLMYWQQSRHWFLDVDPARLPFSTRLNVRELNQLHHAWERLSGEIHDRLVLASRVLVEGKSVIPLPVICPAPVVVQAAPECPVVTKIEVPKKKGVAQASSSSVSSLNSSASSSIAKANDQTQLDDYMQEHKPIPIAGGEKILLIGDSMMQGVAPHLVGVLQRKYGIEAVDMGTKSTGLTYPGFFNWPAKVDEAFAQQQYKLIVVLLGANDTWDMLQNGRYIKFASPLWRENYNQRIEHIVQTAEAQGAKILWLSAPPMGRDDLVKRMPVLNEVLASALSKFPNTVRFVSTAETLTTDGQTFTKFIEVPERGSVMVRKDDGVHFTPYGENLLAKLVLSHLKLTPYKPLAASEKHE